MNNKAPKLNIRSFRLKHDSLNQKQSSFIKNLTERYNKKTSSSKAHIDEYRPYFCDWINSLCFKMSLKDFIYPIVSKKSQGSKFTDIDNNEYIDIAMGYGVCFHGHKPDFVERAVSEQLALGFELGPQVSLTGESAKLISQLTGVERITFCGTGTEAVMASMRIARAATKRDKIVIFSNSFHGTFDGVLGRNYSGETFPITEGTTSNIVGDIIVLDYGTEQSLDYIRKNCSSLAAVMAEPVQTRRPSFQPIDFLREVRKITEANNTALIFDETVTGFRTHPGGIQKLFNINADIVVYGKALGGGLPIGAVCGKNEFMKAVDGGVWRFGDDSHPSDDIVFFAGTYFKHPLSMAATKASLLEIKEKNGYLQEYTNKLTEKLALELNTFFKNNNVPITVSHFSSFFRFESFGNYPLTSDPIELDLFFHLLMLNGVYTWERRICYLSTAHTSSDVEIILKATEEAISELRDGGFEFSI